MIVHNERGVSFELDETEWVNSYYDTHSFVTETTFLLAVTTSRIKRLTYASGYCGFTYVKIESHSMGQNTNSFYLVSNCAFQRYLTALESGQREASNWQEMGF